MIHGLEFLLVFLNHIFCMLFISLQQFLVFFIILFEPWQELFSLLCILNEFLIVLSSFLSILFKIFDLLLDSLKTFFFQFFFTKLPFCLSLLSFTFLHLHFMFLNGLNFLMSFLFLFLKLRQLLIDDHLFLRVCSVIIK